MAKKSVLLTDKAAEARRAYYRAWRATNKDKVRQYNERYWQRKAEQMECEATVEKEVK